MALTTLPKEYFICNILDLNVDNKCIFHKDVRLKMYLNDTKIYINHIFVSTASLTMTISGDAFEQRTLDLRDLPEEVSYEFDY